MLLAMLVLAASPQLKETAQCVKRHCTVADESRAGSAGTVVHLTFPPRSDEEGACAPEEYWLERPGKPATVQLLLRACNDGYGASGVGEDDVSVKGTSFIHHRYGGSSWRWSTTRTVDLRTLTLVSETTDSFHASAPNEGTSTLRDWARFRFASTSELPACDADGMPVQDEDRATTKVSAVDVPQVTLPAPFIDGGWKTTPLGACAAKAEFTIFGAPGPATDASLQVVASPSGELFVEVTDDHFVDNEQKWLFGDHLELWLAGHAQLPDSSSACLGKCGRGALQWAIDLNPLAKVTPGAGNPADVVRAEVVREGTVARAKLVLPPGEWRAVTVVFSDSDDGKKQKRLIATSPFRFNQSVTLGNFRPLPGDQVACEAGPQGLTPRFLQTWKPGEAVLGDEDVE